MTRHSLSAGAVGAAPAQWPAGAVMPLAGDCPTLVTFVHPHCPCSNATVYELAWVLARCPDPVAVYVHMVVPDGAPGGWEQTPLRDEAARLPGVAVHCDDGGREAKRFGAITSGQVLVYDRAGALLFSGGITAGRGHRGDNPGRNAALTALRDGRAAPSSPVYGCPLFTPPAP